MNTISLALLFGSVLSASLALAAAHLKAKARATRRATLGAGRRRM